ncbi:uncharacterized protein [Triticum aestivum]|uniref:uncharacterized protein n=1 Tax=Triticum aestivum TaxID=4565 RepID=UPI001ABD4421|nr:uncharacterized protein LOC123164122 [Triticum aestivum]XP_044437479.1 uncharacterized protein LOC123164122 [Triticum aestivum]
MLWLSRPSSRFQGVLFRTATKHKEQTCYLSKRVFVGFLFRTAMEQKQQTCYFSKRESCTRPAEGFIWFLWSAACLEVSLAQLCLLRRPPLPRWLCAASATTSPVPNWHPLCWHCTHGVGPLLENRAWGSRVLAFVSLPKIKLELSLFRLFYGNSSSVNISHETSNGRSGRVSLSGPKRLSFGGSSWSPPVLKRTDPPPGWCSCAW